LERADENRYKGASLRAEPQDEASPCLRAFYP